MRKSAQQTLPAWGRPAARVTLRGRVALGGDPVAARTLPQVVLVQRRTSRGWVRVARLRAGATGGFRVSLVARGALVRYRAVAGTGAQRAESRVLRIRLG